MLIEKRKLVLLALYLLPFVHSIVLSTIWESALADVIQTVVKGAYTFGLILVGLACVTKSALDALISARALFLYSVFSLVSIVWSVDIARTSMAALAFISLLALALISLRLPRVEVAKALLHSCDAIVVLSIAAYVIGLNGAVVHLQGVARLSGIAYGPHALGRVVVLSILLRTFLYYIGCRSSFLMSLAFMSMYAFVLYMADSRQAYLVLFPALFAIWLMSSASVSKFKATVLVIGVVVASAPLVELPSMLSDKLAAFNRSEADDIASLTGRTFIWSKSIDLVSERPYLGYGLHGGGLMLTQNYAAAVSGWTTESAHNLFLQTALDLGFVGVVLVVFVFIGGVRQSFIARDGLALAFILFSLVLGVVERSIAGAPGFLNFIFFYGLLLVYSVCQKDDVSS